MRKQYEHAYNQKPCRNCGASIVMRQYKGSGKWYPADVHLVAGEEVVIAGEGAHFNWQPRHVCHKGTPEADARNAERAAEQQAARDKEIEDAKLMLAGRDECMTPEYAAAYDALDERVKATMQRMWDKAQALLDAAGELTEARR